MFEHFQVAHPEGYDTCCSLRLTLAANVRDTLCFTALKFWSKAASITDYARARASAALPGTALWGLVHTTCDHT